ncbi:MAG: sensor histidine kinase N-terminal domain-containing protein [Chromatiaceae bacterium]|nr:sensor histidine kinase N-terminal domain-containing protein [Chromatiaceae bacterium]
MSSIRKRLLVLLLGLWTTVWIAIALITLDRSGHEVSELLDAQLAQTAQVLLQITEADTRQDPVISPQASSPMLHPYESKIGFQLWRKGKLISSFGAAPGATLAQMPGYSDQDIGGTQWRIFGLTVGQPNEILFVGQSYSIRQELIEFLTLHALQPILWSLPLTVLLLWLAVSDGLRPLQRLARDIGGRSAERLLPVDESMVPTEVRPLTNALNRLMEQLEQALSAERRFAADASHELRTPLAVIRTHAQIAQRSKDPRERSEALEQLIQGVDRATHLVSQLLTLARLVPSASETEPGTWSLCDTLAQVVEDKRRLARAKSIELRQIIPDADPCKVSMHPSVLGVLVRNLVANAIKYTPEGGWVRVSAETRGAQVLLRVADSGPGIPAVEKERIFERFYRPAGQSEPGAGLGLSIVQRICELHGARIRLRDGDEGFGLNAEVTFPVAISREH